MGNGERGWGREVLHCPYCHGWEVRDQAVGVVATNSLAVHQALLIRNWSADVTVFGHTAALPSRDALGQLAARGIRFVNGEVTALELIEGRLTGVRLRTGGVIGRQAVVVMPRFHARVGWLASVGSKPTEQLADGLVIGSYVHAGPPEPPQFPGCGPPGASRIREPGSSTPPPLD